MSLVLEAFIAGFMVGVVLTVVVVLFINTMRKP